RPSDPFLSRPRKETDPVKTLRSLLQQDILSSESRYPPGLVANLDSYSACRSSTERLWLASFVSLLELGASGLETQQFRSVASRLRLWGLSVDDMFGEGALPPTLNKLVQGILADIAVTLSKHENIFISCLSRVNINRKLINTPNSPPPGGK